MKPRPCARLFIDRAHSAAGVRADVDVCAPLLASDGVIALHDICVRPEDWGPPGAVGPDVWQLLGRPPK